VLQLRLRKQGYIVLTLNISKIIKTKIIENTGEYQSKRESIT